MPMNLRFKASIVLCAALLAPVCEAKKPKTPPAAVAPPPRVSDCSRTCDHRRRHHRVPPRERPARAACSRIRPSRRSRCNITYLVGSRHEGYGETGMAHLLEHMVFKGSPEPQDIPAELSVAGARSTAPPWRPHQLLRDPVGDRREPATGPSPSRPTAWSTQLHRKEDLDSEMTVVRNEFERGENQPGA